MQQCTPATRPRGVTLIMLLVRSGCEKDLEIVVLRNQLTDLRCQIDRSALTGSHRSLLGVIAARAGRRPRTRRRPPQGRSLEPRVG